MTGRVAHRRRRKVEWLTILYWTLLTMLVVAVIMTALSVVLSPQLTSSIGSPPATVATSSPSAKPVPQAAPVTVEKWLFTSASLSIPSIGVNGEISEYTQADAVRNDGVDPPTTDTISWYSGIEGGVLSASATNTTYLYGHSSVGPAVFNDIRQMQPGAIAIITTGSGETLTYVMSEPVFTVSKAELSSDARVTEPKAGRVLFISCNRPDGYDPDSATVENVVAALQLVQPETVP